MAQSANLGPAVHIPPPPRRPRVFYGWFVVLAVFTVTFLGFGTAYTFSVFMGALQRDFAASRGSVSLVFSLAGFLYFFPGLVSGPLADRGVRSGGTHDFGEDGELNLRTDLRSAIAKENSYGPPLICTRCRNVRARHR